MASLLESVIEGSFALGGYTELPALDAATEAAMDERITDEPESMYAYTGECLEGLVAVSAAMATAEGFAAVAYVQGDADKASATMESAIGSAWEKIKEYAQRAWEAIKKFAKKVWEKIKGYFSVFKNFLSKYEKVIKEKNLDGLQVEWAANINPENVLRVQQTLNANYDSAIKTIAGELEKVENQKNFKIDVPDARELNAHLTHALLTALYGSGKRRAEYKNVAAKSIIQPAILAADMGVDKMLQQFMKLGDKKFSDDLKEIQKIDSKAKDLAKDNASSQFTQAVSVLRKYISARIHIQKETSTYLRKGITEYYAQSVKACRAALRYQAGDKSASVSKESTDFSAIMAEIL